MNKDIQFFLEFANSIWKHREDKSRKPLNPLPFSEVKKNIDFNLDHTPSSLEEIQRLLTCFFHYSIDPTHPFSMTQLFTGLHPIGWAGDMLASLANTTMATVEAAPVATHLEETIIQSVIQTFGLNHTGGLMTSGGSLSNLMALLCARQKAFPEVKRTGIYGIQPLAVFVSDDAHYSFSQAITIAGIGLDGLWRVPTNREGEMIPFELENAIQKARSQGQYPLMVVATAGTTTRGSIDPIEEIVFIAKKHAMWVHADATWGGSLLFSQTHKTKLAGISEVDSMAWDAHKTLGIPLSCALFTCRERSLLNTISAVEKADYLFQASEDKSSNLGELSLQCGRRIDALKLWLIWKSLGTSGLELWMDQAVDLAQKAEALIRSDTRFELVSGAHSFAVCFSLKSNADIDQIQKVLRSSGNVLINRVTVNQKRTFRLLTTHYQITLEDIHIMLDLIHEAAFVSH